jgi:hypothetical protein
MTAAAIATTATVEAATITSVFYPAARAGNLEAGHGGVWAAVEAVLVRYASNGSRRVHGVGAARAGAGGVRRAQVRPAEAVGDDC